MTSLPAQAASSKPGRQLLIPWLWFWLIVYLINAPTLISSVWQDYFKAFFINPSSSPLEKANPFMEYTVWSNLVEVAAFVIVFLGVVTILFPQIRAFFFEKSHGLKPVDPQTATNSLQEIRAFILEYLPQAQLRVNLSRFDQFASTYPRGYRTPAVAVFGGLLLLWKKDRRAAEAMLLHEIAHCKQGDVALVGAGSLLQWLIQRWSWLLLGLVPIPLAQVYALFSTWSGMGGLRWEVWFNQSEVGNLLRTDLTSYLVSDLVFLVFEIVHIAAIFILPVVGIWISELSADRYLAENVQNLDDVTRVFQSLRKQTSNFWNNLLAGLSHPPAAWRVWFAANYQNPLSWILPVLAFPFAYLVKLFLSLIGAAGVAWTPGRSWASIALLLKASFKSFLNVYTPLWLAMAGVVLLWPSLAALLDWYFNRQKQPANWSNYRQNLVSAGLIGCLALAGAGLSRNIYIPPEPVESQAEFTPGQHFQLGETIHATGLEVTVLSWKEVSAPDPLYAPQPGNRYVAVEIRLVRTGETAKSTAALTQMKLQDAQGREFEASSKVNSFLKRQAPDGRLAPGETLQGVVGYEIPQAASGLAFVFIDDTLDESQRFLVDLGSQPVAVAVPPSSVSNDVAAHQVQEAIQIGDLLLTVNQAEALQQSAAFHPQPGYGLLVVDFNLENKSRQVVKFPAAPYLELKDDSGSLYELDFHVTNLTGGQANVELNPGEITNYRLGYQAPLAAQKLFFTFSFERDKVLVQLPLPTWPEYTAATPEPTSTGELDLTYQVPSEWIKSRQAAGLPALSGDAMEDLDLLLTECASGVQASCKMNDVFLDVAVPLPTAEATPAKP